MCHLDKGERALSVLSAVFELLAGYLPVFAYENNFDRMSSLSYLTI